MSPERRLPNAHLVRANGFLVSRWKHQKFASTDVYVAKGGNFCLDLRSQPRDRHCCLTGFLWIWFTLELLIQQMDIVSVHSVPNFHTRQIVNTPNKWPGHKNTRRLLYCNVSCYTKQIWTITSNETHFWHTPRDKIYPNWTWFLSLLHRMCNNRCVLVICCVVLSWIFAKVSCLLMGKGGGSFWGIGSLDRLRIAKRNTGKVFDIIKFLNNKRVEQRKIYQEVFYVQFFPVLCISMERWWFVDYFLKVTYQINVVYPMTFRVCAKFSFLFKVFYD